jgi:hypothetical protein
MRNKNRGTVISGAVQEKRERYRFAKGQGVKLRAGR